MFQVENIHSRLYSVNGEWYWDDDPITDGQAAHLAVHYESVVSALKKPWADKDVVPEWAEPTRAEHRSRERSKQYNLGGRPPPKRIY